MCGFIRKDMIKNEDTRDPVVVSLVGDMMLETRLR